MCASRDSRSRLAATMRVARNVFLAFLMLGCATSQFQRHLSAERWSEAARAFAADSSLLDNPRALYEAGVLHGTPGRATYDPERASYLLRRLVQRFPNHDRSTAAAERLALLDQVMRTRRVEARVERLAAQVEQLRARLDATEAERDSLLRSATRLESDLRDREEQLRSLRSELQRLKEIDLKQRPPHH